MVYELRRQPFKALYRLFTSVKFWLLDTPIRALLYAVPYFRPRPSWSFLKCMVVPYVRFWSEFEDVACRTGPIRTWPTHRAIPDKPGATGVWIDPVLATLTPQLLSWARAGSVQPVRIPAYWQADTGPGEATPAASSERVILYFHGGGYMSESAHPTEFMAHIPRTVLPHTPATRALAVEYRLTDLDPLAPPEERNPFPAALLDAVAGYAYLVDTLGFEPENIIVMGDSAGGHLALTLARYIAENTTHLATALKAFAGRTVPPDYHMILFSPWADMGSSHNTQGGSRREFYYDFLGDLSAGLLAEAPKTFATPLGAGAVETNAYISPASRSMNASFKGFPRTFISVGDAERLYDEAVTLKDKMLADCGEERVGWYAAPGGIHDYLLLPLDKEEHDKTLSAIRKWLRQ